MRHETNRIRRRAIVAVQVAISLPVIMGFTALTIDVGTMYNARNDLQRTADAAALAAMGAMAFTNSGDDPLPAAAAAATAFAARNQVAGETLSLDPNKDIIFGRATYNAVTQSYTFTAGATPNNAVRIVARKTEDSQNGAVPLLFAGVFGKSATDISAQAVAMYVDTSTEQADCWDAVPDGMTVICQSGDSDDSDDSEAGDSDDSDDSDSGDSDGATKGDSDDSDDSEAGDSDDSDDSSDSEADSGSDSGSGNKMKSGDSESGDGDSGLGSDSDAPHTVFIDTEALPVYLSKGATIGPCNCNVGDSDDSDDSEAGDSGDSDDSDGDGPGTDGGVTHVTICHVPPGHPESSHTITVGSPSVAAHLAHGDTLGNCVGGGKLRVFLIE